MGRLVVGRSRGQLFGISLGLLALIGAGDYGSTAEGLFTLLYLVPIGLGTYAVGRSFGLFLAATSAVLSFVGETHVQVANHVGELGVFLAFAFIVQRLTEDLARLEASLSETRDGTASLLAARADAQRLLRAVEQADESVVITDAAGAIQYVNPAFTRLTGYSREEAVGRNTRLLQSGKQNAAFYRGLWETILADKVWRGELTNRRRDGSLYLEQMSVTPVRGENAQITHFIAIKQDVSERRSLEDQLRQSQKMEAMGRLAGGVAHDFNNLLAIILGCTEALLRDRAQAEPARRKLEHILKATERAAALTRQLLAFSRREVLQPRVMELNTVVDEASKMLGRLIGEDVELRFVPGAHLGRIKADPGQLEQVIFNLAVNARDAMPGGGTLTLETGRAASGRFVVLSVTDTGCGIDAEVRAHMFEPFYTTKERGKGTGLGLATVYGIVEQSGGSLEVESEVGRGSTFRVYLPEVDDPVTVREATVSAPVEGTESVLVVEDEEPVREVICDLLEASGYRVLSAGSALDALTLAERHRGPLDLLLTDVVMPGMGGRELARQLASRWPPMAVLYMSGYAETGPESAGGLGTGARLLLKPFTVGSLTRSVREALASRLGHSLGSNGGPVAAPGASSPRIDPDPAVELGRHSHW